MSTTINGTTGIAVGGNITATSGWAGTTSSAGLLGSTPIAFACERGGTGTVGGVMSYGNGVAANKGLRMPFSGKLYAATLTGTLITGTVTVQAYLNGVANSSYQLSATATAADIGVTGNWLASPLSFAAGDTLGWYQAAVPTISAAGYDVSYYIVFD